MKTLSRRSFLVTGTLTATGALLAARNTAGAADAATANTTTPSTEKFGGFKLGVQSNSISSISPDLARAVENIAEVELNRAEFLGRHYAVTLEDDAIAQNSAVLARGPVVMDSYFLGNINVNEEQGRRLFEFARKVGVTLLVGQPTPESFPVLDALVKEFNVRVGIHNYGPGRQYDRTEDALKAAAPWDWRIGYCLDTGHCMRSGENPVDAVRRMGHRLFGLHLREHQLVVREGRNPETVIGEGALDLKELCRALRDVHFDGPASFEMYLARRDPLPPLRQSIANFVAAAKATA
jgi:sugar phosphate isomerase/epimerase